MVVVVAGIVVVVVVAIVVVVGGEVVVGPILPVIEDVVAMAEKTLPKTAKIEMNLDRVVGNVILNESQIQTVILNLLANAVDALQERVGEITITLSERKNNA